LHIFAERRFTVATPKGDVLLDDEKTLRDESAARCFGKSLSPRSSIVGERAGPWLHDTRVARSTVDGVQASQSCNAVWRERSLSITASGTARSIEQCRQLLDSVQSIAPIIAG
jgi:hypothetical protein